MAGSGQNFGGLTCLRELASDLGGRASALVFKTLSDPFTGKVSILRVVSGTLASDSTVYNSRGEENERLGHLTALQGKTGTAVPHLVAGDIGGVAKLAWGICGLIPFVPFLYVLTGGELY